MQHASHHTDSCHRVCDLQALCTEASLHALRRQYPQIYSTTHKLLIDPASVTVARGDFLAAFKAVTPSSHRSAVAHARCAALPCFPAHQYLHGVLLCLSQSDSGLVTQPSGSPARPSGSPTWPSGSPTRPSGSPTRPSGSPTWPSESPTRLSGSPTQRFVCKPRQVCGCVASTQAATSCNCVCCLASPHVPQPFVLSPRPHLDPPQSLTC